MNNNTSVAISAIGAQGNQRLFFAGGVFLGAFLATSSIYIFMERESPPIIGDAVRESIVIQCDRVASGQINNAIENQSAGRDRRRQRLMAFERCLDQTPSGRQERISFR